MACYINVRKCVYKIPKPKTRVASGDNLDVVNFDKEDRDIFHCIRPQEMRVAEQTKPNYLAPIGG